MCSPASLGGMAWAAIPAFLKTRFDVNEILTSLMLTYVATLLLSIWCTGPGRTREGFDFPQSRMFDRVRDPAGDSRGHAAARRRAVVALIVGRRGWLVMSRTLIGFEVKVVGQAPARGRATPASAQRAWSGSACSLSGGARRARRPVRGRRADRPADARRSRRATASPRSSSPSSAGCIRSASCSAGLVHGALLSRRRERPDRSVGLPQAVTGVFQGMLLFFLLACDVLIRYRDPPRRRARQEGVPA